ncbi:MAG: hypothetical protein J7K65_02460 [Planctomycetes bacterium]|nr:hypothetical protein [Planctomycetota bacterium]
MLPITPPGNRKKSQSTGCIVRAQKDVIDTKPFISNTLVAESAAVERIDRALSEA